MSVGLRAGLLRRMPLPAAASTAIARAILPSMHRWQLAATAVPRSLPVGCRLFASQTSDAAPRFPLTKCSEQEEEIRANVAKFAEQHVKPLVSQMDEKAKLDPELLKQLFANGYMGVEAPEKYGGAGLSFTSACIVIEELARVDPAISVIVDIQNTLIVTLVNKFGTPQQLERYLPRLTTDTLASFALSEAESGSDAFAMKTTAKLQNGKYILNGTKMWISNAMEAGLYIVFANVDPSKGYKGITAFLVERGTKGLSVGKKENKLGIRASSTCELLLEDVEVSADAVLGEVGKGYKLAIETLNEGRIGIGAQMIGLAQGTFDATMPYLLQRTQFKQPIAQFQGMKFEYAQLRTDIEAARLMVYNAARLKENNEPFVMQAAMAKLYASQVAERVASKCIELVGGVGFTKDFPQEKFFRDSKIGSIYEGTSNLQLQTIADLIIKDFSK